MIYRMHAFNLLLCHKYVKCCGYFTSILLLDSYTEGELPQELHGENY